MCQYCGCRSLRTIDVLTREHDAALEDIRRGRAAAADGDPAAAAEAAGRLLELLAPHTAVEEEGLFPVMAREHPDHVGVLVQEHATVHAALAEVARGTAGAHWAEQLTDALQVLREHIAKEEDGLFPAALTSLSGTDWDAVESVRARVGSALPVPTPT